MNRNVIPSKWFYYYDGNNPKSFKKWVLRYLNETTTTQNEPYTGKNSPRYYGMINGEPFVRKEPDMFINQGCRQINSTRDFHACFEDNSTNMKKDIPRGDAMIRTYADLTRKSWAVSSPNAMVLNFINQLAGSNYKGGGMYYAVIVSPEGAITSKSLSFSKLQQKAIPVYQNSFILNLLISNSDMAFSNHSHQTDIISREASRIDNDILERERIKRFEAEKKLTEYKMREQIKKQIQYCDIPISPDKCYKKEEEKEGLKALSLDPPIIIRKRRK